MLSLNYSLCTYIKPRSRFSSLDDDSEDEEVAKILESPAKPDAGSTSTPDTRTQPAAAAATDSSQVKEEAVAASGPAATAAEAATPGAPGTLTVDTTSARKSAVSDAPATPGTMIPLTPLTPMSRAAVLAQAVAATANPSTKQGTPVTRPPSAVRPGLAFVEAPRVQHPTDLPSPNYFLAPIAEGPKPAAVAAVLPTSAFFAHNDAAPSADAPATSSSLGSIPPSAPADNGAAASASAAEHELPTTQPADSEQQDNSENSVGNTRAASSRLTGLSPTSHAAAQRVGW